MSVRSYVSVRQMLYQYVIGPCGLATCMNEAIIWININYMQNSLMLWWLEHTVLQRQHTQGLGRCDFGTALFQIGAFMVFMVDLLMMDDFSIWFNFYKWRGDDLFRVHPPAHTKFHTELDPVQNPGQLFESWEAAVRHYWGFFPPHPVTFSHP